MDRYGLQSEYVSSRTMALHFEYCKLPGTLRCGTLSPVNSLPASLKTMPIHLACIHLQHSSVHTSNTSRSTAVAVDFVLLGGKLVVVGDLLVWGQVPLREDRDALKLLNSDHLAVAVRLYSARAREGETMNRRVFMNDMTRARAGRRDDAQGYVRRRSG